MNNLNLKNILLALTLVVSIVGCGPKSDEESTTVTKYVGCTKKMEGQGECLRWMDRKVYLAFSNASNPSRNNEFQKAKVKEALQEIESLTSLGSGYFSFEEVDESLLNPIIEPGLSVDQYKSFILIWPDSQFNNYVINELGGNVPDPNAITVINSAYKRKFFMIIRSSCFVSEAACNGISSVGLKAMIARQIGFLSGLAPADCAATPNNVMCAQFPSDNQWGDLPKAQWSATENNILEVIYNNQNYYDEYVPQ